MSKTAAAAAVSTKCGFTNGSAELGTHRKHDGAAELRAQKKERQENLTRTFSCLEGVKFSVSMGKNLL